MLGQLRQHRITLMLTPVFSLRRVGRHAKADGSMCWYGSMMRPICCGGQRSSSQVTKRKVSRQAVRDLSLRAVINLSSLACSGQ